jgi:hypothetical protein
MTYTSNDTVKGTARAFDNAIGRGHGQVAEKFYRRLCKWASEHFNGERDIEDIHALYACIESCLVELTALRDGNLHGLPAAPASCECDNTHAANDTVCRFCFDNLSERDQEKLDDREAVAHLSNLKADYPEYYKQVVGDKLAGAGDVSRDDQNRHQREAKLGFKAPSEDWANCHKIIRCIWPNQILTRPIDKANEFFLFAPAITPLDIYHNRLKYVPHTLPCGDCIGHTDSCETDCNGCEHEEEFDCGFDCPEPGNKPFYSDRPDYDCETCYYSAEFERHNEVDVCNICISSRKDCRWRPIAS